MNFLIMALSLLAASTEVSDEKAFLQKHARMYYLSSKELPDSIECFFEKEAGVTNGKEFGFSASSLKDADDGKIVFAKLNSDKPIILANNGSMEDFTKLPGRYIIYFIETPSKAMLDVLSVYAINRATGDFYWFKTAFWTKDLIAGWKGPPLSRADLTIGHCDIRIPSLVRNQLLKNRKELERLSSGGEEK